MQGTNAAPVEEMEQEDRPSGSSVRIDRQRLEIVMNKRGFTNVGLAERLGKHPNSIQRLKRVQSMPLSELGQLCEVLECHPFDLLVAEGFPEPFCLAPASH